MNQRTSRAWILAASLAATFLAGLCTWWATARGFGVESDSLAYMAVAETWARGDLWQSLHLQSHYPPLYSVVVGSTARCCQVGIVEAGRLVGIATAMLATFLFALFLRRVLVDATGSSRVSLLLFAWTAFLPVTSVQILQLHCCLKSDGLFLLPFLAVLLAWSFYVAPTRKAWALTGVGISVAIGCATRYAGAWLFPVLLLFILVESGKRSRQAIGHLLLFGALSAIPVFLLKLGSAGGTNRTLTGNLPSWGHVRVFFETVASWCVPYRFCVWPVGLMAGLGLLALTLVSLWQFRTLWGRPGPHPDETRIYRLAAYLVALGVSYVAFVFAVTAFIDYPVSFDDRHSVPAQVLFLFVLSAFLALCLRTRHWQLGGLWLLVLISVSGVGALRTIATLSRYHTDGIALSSRTWQDSPLLSYVRQLPPDLPLFSNKHEVVTVVCARPCASVPLKLSSTSAKPNPRLAEELHDLETALRDRQGLVLWFRKDEERFFFLDLETLKQRVPLKATLSFPEGQVYAYDH